MILKISVLYVKCDRFYGYLKFKNLSYSLKSYFYHFSVDPAKGGVNSTARYVCVCVCLSVCVCVCLSVRSNVWNESSWWNTLFADTTTAYIIIAYVITVITITITVITITITAITFFITLITIAVTLITDTAKTTIIIADTITITTNAATFLPLIQNRKNLILLLYYFFYTSNITTYQNSILTLMKTGSTLRR